MIDLGLQRISRLLRHTPLPWRAIHVAGTNGKGSVCADITFLLEAYNMSRWRYRRDVPFINHARFTSPHLVHRWDCITFRGNPVDYGFFQGVERKVLELNDRERIGASEFELLTATAFTIFSELNLDVAVVEVGMGGRLDATNILGQRDIDPPPGMSQDEFRALPFASVITKIGLDHQAFLGDTLQAIAREKAGIIKPGIPVFYDESNTDDVIETIRESASQARSPVSASSMDEMRNSIRTTRSSQVAPAEPKLPPHAFINASLAYKATITALNSIRNLELSPHLERSPHFDVESKLVENDHPLRPSLRDIVQNKLPGRQQEITIAQLVPSRTKPILLDGAHNEQSAEALAEVIPRNQSSGHSEATQPTSSGSAVTWIIATSDSKPPHSILRPLLESGDRVFAVEFGLVDGMPWIKATSCEAIEAAAKEVIVEKVVLEQVNAEQSPESKGSTGASTTRESENPFELDVQKYGNDVLGALRAASEVAGEGPLVVAGSLYLVGDVLRLLEKANRRADALDPKIRPVRFGKFRKVFAVGKDT